MSILKMINGRNLSPSKFRELHRYVIAPSKTKDGQTVGNSGCLSKHVVAEMLAVKRLHHKTGGRQWIHIAVSLTPDEPHRPDEIYKAVAEECVRLFPEYQSFYALHHDTTIRHLHIVLNTVSPTTGRKFSQSKSDLQRMKQQCNDVFKEFGFDIIRTDELELLDASDFSDESDFSFLEPDCSDLITAANGTITVGNQIKVEEAISVTDAISVKDDISVSDEIAVTKKIKPEAVFSFDDSDTFGYISPDYPEPYGGNTMSTPYINPDYPNPQNYAPYPDSWNNPMPVPFYPPMPQPYAPAASVPNEPIQPPNPPTPSAEMPVTPQVVNPMPTYSQLPTITISNGLHLILHENPVDFSISEDTKNLICKLSNNTQKQTEYAANLAWAMQEVAANNGKQLNIHIDVSPTFEIDCPSFTDANSTDDKPSRYYNSDDDNE